MDVLQNSIVLLIFLAAVGYLVTKFVWTPPFLKKKNKDCGGGSCGCS